MADEIEIKVPDIGGASDVDVIEIFVKPGDTIQENDSLITLESDKASMEIPAPSAGVVGKILIKVGDKVSEGSAILTLKTEGGAAQGSKEEPKTEQKEEKKPEPKAEEKSESKPVPKPESKSEQKSIQETTEETEQTSSDALIYAGPAVRRLARELGVELEDVAGSGRKSRITKEDVQNYVKTRLREGAGGGSGATSGLSLAPAPKIDFSKFGAIDVKPLNKIKRLTGQQVHRSWVSIPHVTQFDEADITELEAFRKLEADNAQKAGYKLTILAFVVKAVCRALAAFPQFNASLDASLENLIYKQYYNIGIAVETPNGLVVPVIRDVNNLSVADIAKEMARLSQKAREKGLSPADMSGGNFTISSLGGIGGTAFTPIVNSPEVAILGLSRSLMKPVYDGSTFQARLMLPLSLSYDHRVIDGAEAARFSQYLVGLLSDIRRIIL
jgi:pyruvate dehydrogenase E2 component (dihydrolipoamide acetyltransferase)